MQLACEVHPHERRLCKRRAPANSSLSFLTPLVETDTSELQKQSVPSVTNRPISQKQPVFLGPKLKETYSHLYPRKWPVAEGRVCAQQG